jgi:4-hydroxybenzoate-CoA ligase
MSSENGNAAAWFVDRHVVEGRGDKPAFVECGGGRTLTYGALAERSARMAGLHARLGLQPEDRVAMIMLDDVDFPVIFWGSLKAGVIPVPVNTLLSADYYEIILADSRVKAVFVSPELLPAVEPVLARCPSVRHVFVVGGVTGEHSAFEPELADSEPAPTREALADECAFWLYSSGSTGRPKGVRHVHGSLKATADTFGDKVLGIREHDVVLSAAKLFFAYGLGNAMTFPMAAGATAALYRGRPTPETMFQSMAEIGPTLFCAVPTLFAAMLAHARDAKPAGLERLRLCVSAGEALPQEVGKRWKTLTGVDILDGVGSTEMLHIFLSNQPGDIVYGTSGVAVPGYVVKLVDETGAEVTAAGQVGELLVNGPSAAENYWNQREKSRATFEGRWTRTGDKYERTPEGRYVYCGRTDDMFKVSGIWVAPFEVEQALISHTDVLEAAVVPHRDADGLEKPFAFVVLKGNAEGDVAETLKAHVKERIGAWKYPRWIRIVPDLPKTATGKIQRFKLREELEA